MASETSTTAAAPVSSTTLSSCEDAQPVEIQAMSSKQIKNMAKPQFAAQPEKFYPVTTLKAWGFHRAQCPKCGEHFWRHSETRTVCGDSRCEGKYHFIGRGTGKGARGQKITYAEAWEGFRRSLTSARIPCTAIKRYPVVARWRNDVDYVAAGIYCFQPYCVTGELEPPANPLICPQFCLRFNDLDNIGISGRHFSGFVMLGIQVFNTPQKYVFFKEECVDFNLRWLTEELQISLDEITLVEDVWCGGGNLGPSVEYFIGGLELGNMVFMQYKITDPCTGAYEPLQVQVIDVGIGLERVPWLINGGPTAYVDVFPQALDFLKQTLGIDYMNPIVEKFGPYSCLLNMDEITNIDETYTMVAAACGVPNKEALLAGIKDARDMYILADHTRSVLMAIEDGSLPSAVGGSANLRNILRRVFALMEKNGWWPKLGMKGLLALFQKHREELAALYGPFPEYKSFGDIIEVEYNRWKNTDAKAHQQLAAYLKKRKTITVEDWICCIRNFGASPDKIAEYLKTPPPDNLYTKMSEQDENKVRPPPQQLYDAADLPATEEIFYSNGDLFNFTASIVAVKKFAHLVNNAIFTTDEDRVIVLDRTCFYPNAGGQDNDLGTLTIGDVTYNVVYVEKVSKAILHTLDKPLPKGEWVGTKAVGTVQSERRYQLRNHHTATHIIYQSARRVLGPHVWQHGAKKTVEEAHLDITHYNSLTPEQELEIENTANRAIRANYTITKVMWPKEKAEQTYGFKLYQGGIAPGNTLRVVDIDGFDTEACCGTHCDTTAQVGLIRMIRSHRISDGILRLHFVAGDRALQHMNSETRLVNELCSMWTVQPEDVVPTAKRFFQGYKKYITIAPKQAMELLQLKLKLFLSDTTQNLLLLHADETEPTMFISTIKNLILQMQAKRKAVVVINPTFLYAVLGHTDLINLAGLKEALEAAKHEDKTSKRKKSAPTEALAPKPKMMDTRIDVIKVKNQPAPGTKGKAEYVEVPGSLEIVAPLVNHAPVLTFLATAGFADMKL
ncbi:alanine--tRNA ligase [Pelomyxa schiedti]|nr:alanine--tRNA ligase [Pelomyxa schiedti]